jgi:hypothetical protein
MVLERSSYVIIIVIRAEAVATPLPAALLLIPVAGDQAAQALVEKH